MALSYALLAVLSREKLTGYDLAQRFSGSAGYFWQASHQQIYKTLKKLAEADYVSLEIHPQQKRPDSKVYALTSQGEQYLLSWLKGPVDPVVLRDPLLVKLYAGGFTTSEVLSKELERHQNIHLEKLQAYEAIQAAYFQEAPATLGQLCIQLTLESGLSYERSWLKWCRESIAAIAQFS